jgi:hypothetical protein
VPKSRYNMFRRDNKLALHTMGIPIMSISVPDPKTSATVSINPIPAARANDVVTAGRDFLCPANLSENLRNSSFK